MVLHQQEILNLATRLRNAITYNLEQYSYKNAIFAADKLLTLVHTAGLEHLHQEACWGLGCGYFGRREWRRAYTVFCEFLTVPRFFHMAAKCMDESGEYSECIIVLGEDEDEFSNKIQLMEDKKFVASLCFLRAKSFDMLDNKLRATAWYKETLLNDPAHYEAFEKLVENNLLSSDEEQLLLQSIPFEETDEWLKLIYETKINKYNILKENNTEKLQKYCLGSNIDVIASQAVSHFNAQRYNKAYQLTKSVIEADAYHQSLSLHLSILVALNRATELFQIAHNMVDNYKGSAVTWFAVGCYYYVIGKNEQARQFFTKSTNIDSRFLPAWMGIGHSFAQSDESDQAMAAYRTAHRLFTGSHLPPLCIGMEHARTNNLLLAEQLIEQSSTLCEQDPMVHNEMGVVLYRSKKYKQARLKFEEGLRKCPLGAEALTGEHFDPTDASLHTWEPLLFNLAHTHRKEQNYAEALRLYRICLRLNQSWTVYSAIALTYHLQGNLHMAIEFYHKALSLKTDDSFTAIMLGKALTEMSEQPFEYTLGQEDEQDDFEYDVEENEYSSNSNVVANLF